MIIAIFVVIAAFWVTRRFMGLSGTATSMRSGRGGKDAIAVSLPDDLQVEIRGLVVQNRKIEAIKRVRKYTGWGLKQARDYVESLSAKSSFDAAISPFRNITTDLEDELKRLVLQNRKIEAIRLLRERSGLGLKESKDYIDRLGKLP